MKFLPLIWRNLGRNKLRSAAHRRRDRARDRAGLPAAHHARGPRRAASTTIATNTRISCTTRPGSSTRCPTPTSRRCARCRAWSGAASWTWFGGAFEEEKGVTFPNFAVEPEAIGVGLRGLRHRAGGARGLPALPRRRARRPRHARRVRLEDRRPRHAEEHRLPGRPRLPDRRRDPAATARRTSGSSASTSTRRCARRASASTRSAPSGCASTTRARVEPLMREIDEMFRNSEARDRLRDREELLRELLRDPRGLRHDHPDRDRRWWRSASSSSPPTPRACRCASASARSRC